MWESAVARGLWWLTTVGAWVGWALTAFGAGALYQEIIWHGPGTRWEVLAVCAAGLPILIATIWERGPALWAATIGLDIGERQSAIFFLMAMLVANSSPENLPTLLFAAVASLILYVICYISDLRGAGVSVASRRAEREKHLLEGKLIGFWRAISFVLLALLVFRPSIWQTILSEAVEGHTQKIGSGDLSDLLGKWLRDIPLALIQLSAVAGEAVIVLSLFKWIAKLGNDDVKLGLRRCAFGRLPWWLMVIGVLVGTDVMGTFGGKISMGYSLSRQIVEGGIAVGLLAASLGLLAFGWLYPETVDEGFESFHQERSGETG